MVLSVIALACLLQISLNSRTDALNVANFTRTGMATRRGRRISMEDRAGAWSFECIVNTSSKRTYNVWAVFDGHGSTAISSYLQAALPVYLRWQLCNVTEAFGAEDNDGEDPDMFSRHGGSSNGVRDALLRTFHELDSDLLHRPSSKPSGAKPHPQELAGTLHLGPFRAAAAEAAWDSGSTAVVVVMEWNHKAACQAGTGTDYTADAAEVVTPPTEAVTPPNGPTESATAKLPTAGTSDVMGPLIIEGPRIVPTQTYHNTDGAGGGLGCGRMWIASLGNSPAVLCVPPEDGSPSQSGLGPSQEAEKESVGGESGSRSSDRADSPGSNGSGLFARLLTVSHDFQNQAEVLRVVAAGGSVEPPTTSGGPRRLMGDLEVSRAFGDLQYRTFGVIAEPDITLPWLLAAPDSKTGCAHNSFADAGVTCVSDGGAAGESITLQSGCCKDGAGSLPAHLLLVSDGILEGLTLQEMCDQVRAQLTGAAEPPLTPPPPPAIALGPVTSAGDGMHTPGLHGRQIEASGPVTLADVTGESADGGTAAGDAAASSADDGSAGEARRRGDRDGLPGCCDCELRRATQDMNFESDPCAVQALRRPMHRRVAMRTVESVATRLVQEGVNRGSMDNVAAIVIELPRYLTMPTSDHVIRSDVTPTDLPPTSVTTTTSTPPSPLTSAAIATAGNSAYTHAAVPPAPPVAPITAVHSLMQQPAAATTPTHPPWASSVRAGALGRCRMVPATRAPAMGPAARGAVQPPFRGGAWHPETLQPHKPSSNRHHAGGWAGFLRALLTRATSYCRRLVFRLVTLLQPSWGEMITSLVLRDTENGQQAITAVTGASSSAAAGATAMVASRPELAVAYMPGQDHTGRWDGHSGDILALICPQLRPHDDTGQGGDGWGTSSPRRVGKETATASNGMCEVPERRAPTRGHSSDGMSSRVEADDPESFQDNPEGDGACDAAVREEVAVVSYGYVLAERIAAVPSPPDHLHAAMHGGEALQPWRLSDFDGASTFIMPDASGVAATGSLLDFLRSYCMRPYDTTSAVAAALSGAAIHRPHGSDCEAAPLEHCTEGSSFSHALMSYSSTHSLLLEIAAVPLQQALYGNSGSSRVSPASPSAPSSSSATTDAAAVGGDGGGGDGGAHTATSFLIGGGYGIACEDVAPALNQRPPATTHQAGGDESTARRDQHPDTEKDLAGRPEPRTHDLHTHDLAVPQLVLSADPWDGGHRAFFGGVPGRRGRELLGDKTPTRYDGEDYEDDNHGVDVSSSSSSSREVVDVGGGRATLRITPVPAAAVAGGGSHLRNQPRAHGVRLADGSLHLVTDESDHDSTAAKTVNGAANATDASRGYGGHPPTRGASHATAGLTHAYRLRERFGQGHFGEVWRAWRLDRFPFQGDDGESFTAGRTDSRRRQQQQQQQQAGPTDAASMAAAAAAAAALVEHGPPGFVLKRLRGSGGLGVLLSGLREAYFGRLLLGLQDTTTVGGPDEAAEAGRQSARGYDHLVECLESFEVVSEDNDQDETYPTTERDGGQGGNGSDSAAHPPPDLWLVLRDAGRSLHDLIYSPVGLHTVREEQEENQEEEGSEQQGGLGGSGGASEEQQSGRSAGMSFQVLGPSPWWLAMRRHPQGQDFIRGLLRQLLLGLKVVHEANITHRDVKPENMMLTRLTPVSATRVTVDASAGDTAAGDAAEPWSPYTPSPSPSTSSDHQPHQPVPLTRPSLQSDSPRVSPLAFSAGAGGYRSTVDEDFSTYASSTTCGGEGGGGGDGGCKSSSSGGEGTSPPGAAEPVAPVWLRLIDFGSAVDEYSLQHLYGIEGPTSDQLTLEYAPPEALFGRYWEGMKTMRPRAWAYDIWSVGVVWLELLMATPQVWQLPAATRALLEVRLGRQARPESQRQLVFLLRGLMEWCIYPPQAPSSSPSGPPLRGHKSRLLVSWTCTEEALLALARSRDPLGVGLEGPMALRLLLRLLHWDPASRPSARQALQHAFFTVSPSAWAIHMCGVVEIGESGWC